MYEVRRAIQCLTFGDLKKAISDIPDDEEIFQPDGKSYIVAFTKWKLESSVEHDKEILEEEKINKKVKKVNPIKYGIEVGERSEFMNKVEKNS